jgi:hypothetical protein
MSDIWYVSYGSNMCYERFQCYIRGGRPVGSLRDEKGCSDPSPAREVRAGVIPFRLYFSREARRWSNGGAAFIAGEPGTGETWVTKYLISREQFKEVFAQENGREIENLDFESIKRGNGVISPDSWYGRILFLGNGDGAEEYTFTTVGDSGHRNPPSDAYLSVIITGLLESGRQPDEIVSYLAATEGIGRGQAAIRDIINGGLCRR